MSTFGGSGAKRSPKLLESSQGERFPAKVSPVLESFFDVLGHLGGMCFACVFELLHFRNFKRMLSPKVPKR